MGCLYEVREVFGDFMGSMGVIYMRFRKCMGILGGHNGHFYEVSEVYGDSRGSYRAVYIEYWRCMGPLVGCVVIKFHI